MDEGELETSLSTYKKQLEEIENALLVSGHDDELNNLKNDLTQLIQLSEESLLSIKKTRLLSMLSDGQAESQYKPSIDDEFAAFQATLGADSHKADDGVLQHFGENSLDSSFSGSSDETRPAMDLSDIVGTKCRIPYAPEWGHIEHHNALILCAEDITSDNEPRVKVLFCNPTSSKMLTCPYFMEGKCKFSEEECRFCHGYTVDVAKLDEYLDTDYSNLQLEAPCLAKYSDNIWYPGIVVEVPKGTSDQDVGHYKVLFDDYEQTVDVAHEDIVPWESSSSESDDENENSHRSNRQSEEEDALPVFLWKPQTTEAMGDWEKYTKGIGSKLMAKMGFITGHGLGKNGEGRAEPVPIQLLPQGKSLDKIMELKEIAGDRNLYDVMDKLKKKMKSTEGQSTKSYRRVEQLDVFEIINKKLGSKKGDLKKLLPHHQGQSTPAKHISAKDLNSKSNKDINIQLLQTQNEIKKAQKEVNRLESAVQRNKGVEPVVAKQYQRKLEDMQHYLKQLESSQQTIENHKDKRQNLKNMHVF